MLKNLIYIIILLNLKIIPKVDQYNLTVQVSGLKPLTGDLYISLHNRAEYFAVADSAFLKRKLPVNEATESLVFKNIPAGKYAVSAFHDKNLNGVLDVNAKGVPVEGYGFSTKAKALGRPRFEQASFELCRHDTIEIRIIYPNIPVK